MSNLRGIKPQSVLAEKATVWKLRHAASAEILIDAAEYYASLYEALGKAQRSIFILGWDMDSRLQLVPTNPWSARPGLAGYLKGMVESQPQLHIYLLLWDFSSIYLLDREAFQSIKLGLGSHPRIHFSFDDRHPVWASHHQKLVVIDDTLAYCGGIDLTGSRWDTSAHNPSDPRRVTPGGKRYPPFHDCQMAVTGEPARWLGELARDRWQRATGLTAATKVACDLDLKRFDLGPEAARNVLVGIARTEPAFQDVKPVREVERLFSAMINHAEKYIYIENQYFTASVVCERLKESLLRPKGPEVVVILPKIQDSLLAKLTMGTLSMRCLASMYEADKHGRFHAYYPEDSRLLGDEYINVHAKVMIVDDVYARVGSANLNNRSMGLDTECDLILDATGDLSAAKYVRNFLARLLADHTGSSVSSVNDALNRNADGIRAAIHDLSHNSEQTLVPFALPSKYSGLQELIAEVELIDLDQAHPFERALDEFVFGAGRAFNLPRRVPAGLFLSFAFCLTVAAALALVPLFGNFPDAVSRLLQVAPKMTPASLAPLLFAFVIAGVAFIPLNLMIIATASILPLGPAFVFTVSGTVLSALVGYGVGRLAGLKHLKRLFPRHDILLLKARGKRNFLPMLLVRFFPIAPFALVNLILGARKVRLGSYVAGTVLGVLPGAVALVLFQRALLELLAAPSFGRLIILSLATGVVTQSFRFLSRRFGKMAGQMTYG